jgi:putative ABC transport system permease protein
MLTITQTFRHGRRFFGRNLSFSLPAVAILGLGVGANVAIFAVAYAVLLRPLPFADQDALVIMWERDERRNQPLWEVSYRNFIDWRTENRSFIDLAAMGSVNWSLKLIQDDATVNLPLAAVSGSFFEVLGASPALGRGFVATDDERSSARVAVLSDHTWRTQFGADPNVVGRTARMESGPGTSNLTIIGVRPGGGDRQ